MKTARSRTLVLDFSSSKFGLQSDICGKEEPLLCPTAPTARNYSTDSFAAAQIFLCFDILLIKMGL